MRVYLDGQPVANAGTTLADALSAARAAVGSRLLVEATADGAPIPEDHFDLPPATSPYAGELRFTSADPVALARCTLGEAGDVLVTIRNQQKRAAACVQSGRVAEALPTISEVLAGWSAIRQAVEVVIQPALGLQFAPAAADALPGNISGLAQQLGAMKRALSSQDWAGLGDSLAYDLDDMADRWTGYLSDLSRALAPRA